MDELDEDPDAFRLLVEVWVHAQRDEELRDRLVTGMDAWRTTFRDFATARREYGELAEVPEPALEQFATVMLAFATGLGMVKLADPDSVSPRLLGAVFALVIRALETSEEARELLAQSDLDAAKRLR
jgi:hypothetical protein